MYPHILLPYLCAAPTGAGPSPGASLKGWGTEYSAAPPQAPPAMALRPGPAWHAAQVALQDWLLWGAEGNKGPRWLPGKVYLPVAASSLPSSSGHMAARCLSREQQQAVCFVRPNSSTTGSKKKSVINHTGKNAIWTAYPESILAPNPTNLEKCCL